jgi:hypothetical protein
VEKDELIKLLSTVSEESPLFPRAKRILEDLTFFPSLQKNLVPQGSVLKEFID